MNLKKCLTKMISIFLAITVFMIGFSSDVLKVFAVEPSSELEVDSIRVISAPTNTDYIYGVDGDEATRWDNNLHAYVPFFNYYVYITSGFQMEVSYTNGTKDVYSYDEVHSNEFKGNYVSLNTTQEDEPWGLGKHTVEVEYLAKTASFEVEVVENPVESIQLLSCPIKTNYVYNLDGWDSTYWNSELGEYVPFFIYYVDNYHAGIQLKVNYTDGTSAITSSEETYEFKGHSITIKTNQRIEPWGLGEHTATVSYMGKEASFEVQVVENTVASIKMINTPSKTTFVCEVDGNQLTYWDNELQMDVPYFDYYIYNLDGLKIEVTYTDGTTATYSYDNAGGGEFNGHCFSFDTNQQGEPWGVGKHTVNVSYMGSTTSYEVEVVENPVASIEIISVPDKTEYIFEADGYWSERWDNNSQTNVPYFNYTIGNLTGFQMEVTYSNGTKAVYSYDETNSSEFDGSEVSIDANQYDEPWGLGKHSVTVTYMSRTASYDVEVVENPVSSIEIVSAPDKTDYIFEGDGSWATRWDSDSQTEVPYFDYNTYNRDGFQMKVNYTNGTTAVYSYDETNSYEFEGSYVSIDSNQWNEPWGLGKHSVTVTYMGRTVSFDVEVVENPVASIQVVSLPDKTQLIKNVDGYESSYWDDDLQEYVPYFEYDIYNDNLVGFQMKVNYTDGTSSTFTVDRYSSLEYKGHPVSFESNQDSNPWDVGKHEVTATYMGRSTTYQLEVIENPVKSIQILSAPQTTKYIQDADGYLNTYWNDELQQDESYFYYTVDTGNGFQMKVNYTDGTSAIYSYDEMGYYFNNKFIDFYTDQDINHWGLGKHMVTVEYMDRTATFEVEVVENPIDSIQVVALPSKTNYVFEGDGRTLTYWDNELQEEVPYFDYFLDYSGLKLKINYKNGTSTVWDYNPYDNDINGYWIDCQDNQYQNPWDMGKHTVNVNYMGTSTSFDVEVVPSNVKAIEIVSLPTDNNYFVGEVANINGLKLKVTYNDNTSKVVTADYSIRDDYSSFSDSLMIDGYYCSFGFEDGNQAVLGKNNVVIHYLSQTTSFEVNATENKMDHFILKKDPTNYSGENMVITVFEKDGSSYDLTYLGIDYRDGNSEPGYAQSSGYVWTERGIYPFSSEVSYENNNKVTNYTFMFNEMEVSGTSLPLTSACVFATNTVFAGSLVMPNEEGYTFNGTVTAENIDAIAMSAMDASSYWEYSISANMLIGMIKSIYDCDTVDLTLSKYFNAEKGLYTSPFNGSSGSLYEIINASLDQNGNYSIEFTWQLNANAEQTRIITVSKDQKIMSITSPSIVGDINEDGIVDLMDVTTLSRIVAGWQNVSANLSHCDTNGDFIVDLKDVTLLSRYVAGWSGIILH